MTEFEHQTLFFQIMEAASATLGNYMTVTFGMLAASYFVAHRLDRVMTGLLLTIYSLFALGLAREIYSVYADFARLGIEIQNLGQQPGSSLGWAGPVIAGDPGAMTVVPIVITTVTLSAYAGTLLFFFRCRKQRISAG